MNQCYNCKHRFDLPGDEHSQCNHPALISECKILALVIVGGGREVGEPFNLRYNTHGVRNGWFCWPMNFDPVWLENCDAFEAKK